jgi:hypothetical protein
VLPCLSDGRTFAASNFHIMVAHLCKKTKKCRELHVTAFN